MTFFDVFEKTAIFTALLEHEGVEQVKIGGHNAEKYVSELSEYQIRFSLPLAVFAPCSFEIWTFFRF